MQFASRKLRLELDSRLRLLAQFARNSQLQGRRIKLFCYHARCSHVVRRSPVVLLCYVDTGLDFAAWRGAL